MDPATTFSLACGTLQVIGFGIQTAKAFHEIHKSSTSTPADHERFEEEAVQLGKASSSLSALLNDLQAVEGKLNRDQKQLRNIARECDDAVHDMTNKLDGLKISGPGRKRDVTGQWVKIVRERSNIDIIKKTLESKQQLLNTQMLVNISRAVDFNNAQHLETLQRIDMSGVQSLSFLSSMKQSFQDVVNAAVGAYSAEVRATKTLVQDFIRGDSVIRVLDSLYFPSLDSRQEEIPDVYHETYEWIFDQDTDACGRWPNFAKWLQNGRGIYWINGKAGSGKSTLMKYLTEADRLSSYFESWAGDRSLLVLKFFFSRAGTKEQRTLNGLLRSMLHQILSHQRALVSLLGLHGARSIPTWTNKRLSQALKAVLIETDSTSCFCFIIDGLDEFEGDVDAQELLVEVIRNLAQSESIKCIVSSRPDPMMFDAFSIYPRLRLQDLTARDMETYVKGKLTSQHRIRIYQKNQHEAVENLVRQICVKADGVFLWTYLVVQDLLRRICERESLAALETRLLHLQNSLSGVFIQFLDAFDQSQATRAANYISFAMEWERSMPDCLSVLEFAFAMIDGFERAFFLKIQNDVDDKACVEWCYQQLKDIVIVLPSITAGFLEVVDEGGLENCNSLVLTTPLCPRCNRNGSPPFVSLFEMVCDHYHEHVRIGVIHRSVFEFFETNQRASLFISKADMNDDAIKTRILRSRLNYLTAILGQIKDLLNQDQPLEYREEVTVHRTLLLQLIYSFIEGVHKFFDLMIGYLNSDDFSTRQSTLNACFSNWRDGTNLILDLIEKGTVFFNNPAASRVKWLPAIWMKSLNSDQVHECLFLSYGQFDWFHRSYECNFNGSLQVHWLWAVSGAFNWYGSGRSKTSMSDLTMFQAVVGKLVRRGLDLNDQCALAEFDNKPRITNWQYFLNGFLTSVFELKAVHMSQSQMTELLTIVFQLLELGADSNASVILEVAGTGLNEDYKVTAELSFLKALKQVSEDIFGRERVISLANTFQARETFRIISIVRTYRKKDCEEEEKRVEVSESQSAEISSVFESAVSASDDSVTLYDTYVRIDRIKLIGSLREVLRSICDEI